MADFSIGQALCSAIISPEVGSASIGTLLNRRQKENGISNIVERKGFNDISLGIERTNLTIPHNKLQMYFDTLRNWSGITRLQPEQRETIMNEIRRASELESSTFQNATFHIAFSSGIGSIQLLVISVQDLGNDKFYITQASMIGSFTLAPDYIIERVSKSKLLKTTSNERIVMVPRGLTNEDIQAIMQSTLAPCWDLLNIQVPNIVQQRNQ